MGERKSGSQHSRGHHETLQLLPKNRGSDHRKSSPGKTLQVSSLALEMLQLNVYELPEETERPLEESPRLGRDRRASEDEAKTRHSVSPLYISSQGPISPAPVTPAFFHENPFEIRNWWNDMVK